MAGEFLVRKLGCLVVRYGVRLGLMERGMAWIRACFIPHLVRVGSIRAAAYGSLEADPPTALLQKADELIPPLEGDLLALPHTVSVSTTPREPGICWQSLFLWEERHERRGNKKRRR